LLASSDVAANSSVASERDRWRAPDTIAVLALVLASVVVLVVLRHMLTRPLWYNEQWRAWHFSLGRRFLEELSQINSPVSAGWVMVSKASIAVLGNTEIALRLPLTPAVPALAVVGYLLARRWLGVVGSLLVMVVLLCNVMVMTYAEQLAPYNLEAVCAVAVLLLWIQADESPPRACARWGRYLGMGALAIIATPVAFVLGPLLLVDVVRSVRERRWWPLGPATAAGLPAIAHLVVFIGLQTGQSKGSFWDAYFLPHSPLAATRFLGRQLASYVPKALTGQSSYLPSVPEGTLTLGRGLTILLTAFMLAGLASGVVVAFADSTVRPVLLVVVGGLAAELFASRLRLWPFGFARVNTFLLPFGYLLAGIGIARVAGLVLRQSRRGVFQPGSVHLGRSASLRAIGLSVIVVFVAGGYLDVLGVGARQLAAIQRDANGPAFAMGMPNLVAAARVHAVPSDAAVVVHAMAWKGWDYYMRFHRDELSALGQAPRIGPDRTLMLEGRPEQRLQEDQELAAFLARQSQARHLFVLILSGVEPAVAQGIVRSAEAAGFHRAKGWRESHTGSLFEFARA